MLRNHLIRFAQALLQRNVWFVALLQSFLILCSLLLAWLLRFDFSLPQRRLLFASIPILLTVRLACMAYFGLMHGWWRYVGISDLLDISKAIIAGSLGFGLISRYGFGLVSFPKSVYILEAVLSGCLLAGVRLFSRILAESVRQDLTAAKRVVVIGAGAAGQMVIRELRQPKSGYNVLCCLDDDRTKIRSKVQGVPIVGTVDELPHLFAGDRECEVIIAIPSATSSQMRRFVALAEEAGLRYRTMPALRDLIVGKVLLKQVREVNLDDLLGREAVVVDLEAVHREISRKVVMVTGAAGSIGSELCKQILHFSPEKLVALDQNENGIFHLDMQLSSSAGSDLVFCVADVRDRERLRRICIDHQVETIFHAAAYKHVPVMENNVDEAVQNNVFSLLTMLDVAEEAGCRELVLISSDKAVNPTSVMGATKRICELIVASRPPNGLRCSSVRFGNVLGSNGSVVPIFQEQLRRNLPLTVTHPDIQRFFMTTQEAVSLVLQAFAIGRHGDVLVLDMGIPVKILDLAKSLIRLAGKSESEVEIQFTGLRPGEKLNEELFYDTEEIFPTSHSKIKRTRGREIAWPQLLQQLDDLRNTIALGSNGELLERIRDIVPEFRDGRELPATGRSRTASAAQG